MSRDAGEFQFSLDMTQHYPNGEQQNRRLHQAVKQDIGSIFIRSHGGNQHYPINFTEDGQSIQSQRLGPP